jgi:hypothetical protein
MGGKGKRPQEPPGGAPPNVPKKQKAGTVTTAQDTTEMKEDLDDSYDYEFCCM